MRLTRGCGNLDVASLVWVVCQLRQLKKGGMLTGMKVVRMELRLVSGARRIPGGTQMIQNELEVW
jgi:hypothetical protein